MATSIRCAPFRAFHTGFRAFGIDYLPEQPVSAISKSGGEFRLTTPKGELRAAKIVLAAGNANQTLAPMVGLYAPMGPTRGQIVVTERTMPFLPHPLTTIRQTDEGTVMIGDSKEDELDDRALKHSISAVMADRAQRMFPHLARLNVVRSWAGIRVMPQDGFPIYDQSETHPGAFVACCHSGVTLASNHEDRHPRRMSGGQQQRVALARALVIKPSVLLLDEPLSNLDAKLREEMQIELRQIQRTIGTTTILVTHDQNEAMSLSDRIVVMSQGRIEQIGTPQETYERPASAFVSQFLGKTNDFAGDRSIGPRRRRGWWRAPGARRRRPASAVLSPSASAPSESASATRASAAKIVTRIFQGNHWLFQCESECGPAIVIRQNDGKPQPAEGEAVRLTWRPEDMSVRARRRRMSDGSPTQTQRARAHGC